MREIREGAKVDILCGIRPDPGAITPTGQYRILDSARALKQAWGPATWDATARKVYGRFDSTVPGLSTPGVYFVQFLVTIATEVYDCEAAVQLKEWGP